MKLNAAIITLAGTAAIASGSVVPFSESFDAGANNWLSGAFTPLTWNAAGAADGSSYVSANLDLNNAGPFGLTVIRGQADQGASGGAFAGDYLAGGITTVSFDFRHNAGQDLGIALRVAQPANFPAFAVELPETVESGSWVTLSFELSFFNPLVTIEGAPSPAAFNAIMANVGNLLISADRPDGLDTPLLVDFDIDNVTITPTPSSAALLGLGGLFAARRRR
jgi:hypothetical protein